MLMLLIFVLILLVIALIVVCCKNRNLSEKNKKRIKDAKRKVMWNPVIRYLFLNSLKINYSAACVFKHTDAGAWSQFVAVLMLVGINVCPLILSRILFKNNGVLEDKEKISKFGTLYEGRNVPADRKHRVWIFPLVFFFRRSLFIIGTLVLFDYPA